VILSRINILSVFCLLSLLACEREDQESIPIQTLEEINTSNPQGFPELIAPEDNRYTDERWSLGKKLFFEKKLSKDGQISCASCHQASFAFADQVAFSVGAFGRSGTRNAPSLANVGYHPYLMREGGVPTLEMQALVPIQEENEFDHNIVKISESLSTDQSYRRMSQAAYERDIDAYVITRALAVFQRSIISGNSRFDRYQYQGIPSALSNNERIGMDLFFSNRTNCSSCHGGFNFSNYSFQNNGLDSAYADVGRFRLTNDSNDLSLFKVPSLRNVSITPPYMHDGRFHSLSEVVEHYDKGGRPHPNKSQLIKPLFLNNKEKAALIAFLHTLTDHEFINDPRWRP